MGVINTIRAQKRWFYVVLAFVQAGLTAGIIFGWGDLVLILSKEGVYADHCPPNTERPCDAQLSFFSLIFTVGVFSNNAAPLLTGIFLDKFGPKITNLVSVFLFMCGCALFTIPSPEALIPGLALLGFAGPGIYVSIMHLNNLFPGRQATVLTFFSGTFTVSNFVFKVFKMLNDHKPWFNLDHLFICFIVLLVPIFLVGGIFWPNKPFQLPETKPSEDEDSIQEKVPLVHKKGILANKLYGAGLKVQITAPEFWLIVMWMAVSNLHISFFLGTNDSQFPNSYHSIFTWIWDFGFIAIPLVGLTLDYKGIIFAIFISNVLLFIFSVINVVPVLPLQYVGFVLISGVNVGIWSIFYTFLSKTFGFNNYGKLLGTACATIAIVGLLQYPLFTVTLKTLNKNFLPVNLLFVVLTFCVFATPLFLWRREKQQQRMQQQSYEEASVNYRK